MFALKDIIWSDCPVQDMTRASCPSNVFWVSENDPKKAWEQAVLGVLSSPNAVAIWDTLPVIDDPAIEQYVLSRFKGSNALSIPKKEGRISFAQSAEDKNLTGSADTKQFFTNLSEAFNSRSFKWLDWRGNKLLQAWADTMKAVMHGLDDAYPHHTKRTSLMVGSGLGLTHNGNNYGMHVDIGKNDTLNVGWAQFGKTTVFVDDAEVVRADPPKVYLKNAKPTVWQAPKGALTLFTIGGAVHGFPVADISDPVGPVQSRAFLRQRISL